MTVTGVLRTASTYPSSPIGSDDGHGEDGGRGRWGRIGENGERGRRGWTERRLAQSLQATALFNEAYLKLVDAKEISVRDRVLLVTARTVTPPGRCYR